MQGWNEHEAIRGIERLQQAVRRHVGSRPASFSKSVPLDSLARTGGNGGIGATRPFLLASELAAFSVTKSHED